MPLTDVFIRSLKPLKKPYKHFDGGGLHIQCHGKREQALAYVLSF